MLTNWYWKVGWLILTLLTACGGSVQSGKTVQPAGTHTGEAALPSVTQPSEAPQPILPTQPAADLELIIFYSPACEPCQEVIAVFQAVEPDYRARIAFTWVNVLDANNAALMESYGFSSPPEVYLVNPQGEVLDYWDEAPAPEDLRLALDFALELEAGE